MKKWLSALLAVVLLFSAVAMAAPVKSKTSSDLTKITSITAGGEDVTSMGYIFVTEDSVMALDELDKIIETVNVQKKAPIEHFDAATQQAMLDLVRTTNPEVETLADWNLNEFVSLGVAPEYSAEVGDLVLTFEFPTPFKVGQKVTAVVGTFDGTRTEVAEGKYEYNVKWTPLEGEVVAAAADNSQVAVKFPTDTILEMQGSVANVMAVLAEPVAD